MKKTKRDKIPDTLRSTYDLITAAFPTGVDADLYIPLLAFLQPHMSHRNLADVIYLTTDVDYVQAGVDLVDAVGAYVGDDVKLRLKQTLEPHGLAAWLAES